MTAAFALRFVAAVLHNRTPDPVLSVLGMHPGSAATLCTRGHERSSPPGMQSINGISIA